jgi:hypothetical protein
MRRVTAGVVGFAVAPLVPAIFFAVRNSLVGPWDVVARVAMVPMVYLPSALFTVVFGLPIFFLFLRFRLIRWWSVLGAGLGIGALVGVIVQSPNLQPPEILFTAVTGAASALCFWLFWRQGREVVGIDDGNQKRPVRS